MRWTCLSLVALRPILADNQDVQVSVGKMIHQFADEDETASNHDLTTVQKIDKNVLKASFCLLQLHDALCETDDLTEEVQGILRRHESLISELEQINIEADCLEWVDDGTFDVQNAINHDSHQIISQFHGVLDELNWTLIALISSSRLVELFCNPRKLQFIRPKKLSQAFAPWP